MHAIVVSVSILSVFHSILGVMSVCLGVAASIQAEVWLAHSISPIWSGGIFTITGILGFACAKRRTAYMIMCFTAFSIVSLVTTVVSIQLLRMGLVNQTTDGSIYQKEHKDRLILVAIGCAGVECLVCLVSSLVSCRLARAAKKDMERKRDGTFHVQDDEGSLDNNNRCAVYTVEKGYHNPNMYGVPDETSVDQDQVTISITNEHGEQLLLPQTNNNNGLDSNLLSHHPSQEEGVEAKEATTDKDAKHVADTDTHDGAEVQGKVVTQDNKVRVEIEDHTDDEETVRTPNVLFLAQSSSNTSNINTKRDKKRLTIVDNLSTQSQTGKKSE